jgi:hypothetical protein
MFHVVWQSTYMGDKLCRWAIVHLLNLCTISSTGVTNIAQYMNSLWTDTSRKTCLLRSTHVRLAVPCDWVVTRGLLRGRFWLCRMTCTWWESWCSRRSHSGICRRRLVPHSSPLWIIFYPISSSFSDVDVWHPTCPVGSCTVVAFAVVIG